MEKIHFHPTANMPIYQFSPQTENLKNFSNLPVQIPQKYPKSKIASGVKASLDASFLFKWGNWLIAEFNKNCYNVILTLTKKNFLKVHEKKK